MARIVRRFRVLAAREGGSSLPRSLAEVVLMVGAAFVLALLIQQFVVKPFWIPSESMSPTLEGGDRVLVNRFIYYFEEPARGDIVVFNPPVDRDQDYIKRIVAVEGDTVSVHEGRLYVNGERQAEDYLQDPEIAGQYPRETIPDDHVFVMGDNRNHSGDSRLFGPVSEESIVGRAFLIYWPPSDIGGL